MKMITDGSQGKGVIWFGQGCAGQDSYLYPYPHYPRVDFPPPTKKKQVPISIDFATKTYQVFKILKNRPTAI